MMLDNKVPNEYLTDAFLESLFSMKNKGISSRSKQKAQECLLDFLGCALAGNAILKNDYPSIFETEKIIGASGCSVLGQGLRTNASRAALINGMGAHVTELDDGHRMGMLHLGSAIIPALIAAVETEPVAGSDFLTGIVMGYEAAARLARCLQPGHRNKGFHTTGTCGTVGAAMAIAFAFSYDYKQAKASLTCAVSAAAGLLEIQEDASDLKPFSAGRAALDGYNSAMLGKTGFESPMDILGGRRGFFEVLANGEVDESLLYSDNEKAEIENIYFKLYASCRHSHPAVEAALQIKNANNLSSEDVLRVNIKTYEAAIQGHDHKEILSISSAKMSTPFSVALALSQGHAELSDFSNKSINNENILALAKKTNMILDDELSKISPKKRAAIVEVLTKGGQYNARVDYPKGEPENPLSDEELKGKFISLATYAGKTLSEAEKIIQVVDRVEEDLPTLLSLI